MSGAAWVEAIERASLVRRIGTVRQLVGQAIEADGPDAAVGELCSIAARHAAEPVMAEVVGARAGRVTLMPYGSTQGLAAGALVQALGRVADASVGYALLGRVVDCFGRPLDGLDTPACRETRPLAGVRQNPLLRPPVGQVLETGVRTIDGLLTLGRGQRVGIFAGSGVGKSTLLGMIARTVRADINVIALIGERGREVREFIERQLGEDGLARSVVVVATSDEPALARVRATYLALAIAEYFREAGADVLLTMDSITRFAMARRELGLAAGEPPTARGYTPSVFAELPELCERCGTAPGGGSISALLTVLVEGDDFNEPVSDALRATLDGHLVLSRQLAHQGRFPAIDVLASASRLLGELCTPAQRELVSETRRVLAMLERNRQIVEIGAYQPGSNPQLDRALQIAPALDAWLRQRVDETAGRDEAYAALQTLLKGAVAGSNETRKVAS
jgi:flagellum-specific ATP synthase